MGYKTILVHCDTGRGAAGRLKLALDLADRSDAHVIGLHVRQAFQAPAFTDAGPAMDSLYRSYETAVKADEAIAAGVFRETVGPGYSSEWRVADGYVDDIVVAQARYADLVVVGQAEPDSPPMATPSDLAEDVTMASERPVL
ncbi:MAG TPA: universal stress protein, partial [Reyranella sp.]|nr:universal stress protein [Reyranella sp.]